MCPPSPPPSHKTQITMYVLCIRTHTHTHCVGICAHSMQLSFLVWGEWRIIDLVGHWPDVPTGLTPCGNSQRHQHLSNLSRQYTHLIGVEWKLLAECFHFPPSVMLLLMFHSEAFYFSFMTNKAQVHQSAHTTDDFLSLGKSQVSQPVPALHP